MSIVAFGLGPTGTGGAGVPSEPIIITRVGQIKDAKLSVSILSASIEIPEISGVELEMPMVNAAIVTPKLDAEIFDEC